MGVKLKAIFNVIWKLSGIIGEKGTMSNLITSMAIMRSDHINQCAWTFNYSNRLLFSAFVLILQIRKEKNINSCCNCVLLH